MCPSLHVFAGGEDVLHQFHIVEHQGQPQGLWVTVKLPEDVQGTLQQGRVLWLRDIAHTAAMEGERRREEWQRKFRITEERNFCLFRLLLAHYRCIEAEAECGTGV